MYSRSYKREEFGTIPDSRAVVYLFTLTNKNGVEVRITNFGATVVSIRVPDRKGNFADVALGFDNLAGYLGAGNPYFGCTIGRYANRIGGAVFSIDGNVYKLEANDGVNHLHGGLKGFDKKVWEAVPFVNQLGSGVNLTCFSPDGEEGYPGNLNCKVTYLLTDNNELIIRYEARTDKATVVNLTNHSYFNLGGEGTGNILGHILKLYAQNFTVIGGGGIPTGEMRHVIASPMDFTEPMMIGARINCDDPQLKIVNGYDHNFVLDSGCSEHPELAATLYEPKSGRVMDVLTTEPGIQLYTGNWLNVTGKGGHAYEPRSGLCLETQHFPDSPNKPDFPSVVLRPGRVYRTATVYRFSTAK